MSKVDFSELEVFQEKLEQLSKTEIDEFLTKTCKQLGARHMRQAIQNTPVDTGQLKKAWQVSNVSKRSNEYEIDVSNSMEYAIYVEYGHRQQVGRFVPAIGKKLKKGWVNGHYMLTNAEEKLKPKIPSIIEKELNKTLKEKLQ